MMFTTTAVRYFMNNLAFVFHRVTVAFVYLFIALRRCSSKWWRGAGREIWNLVYKYTKFLLVFHDIFMRLNNNLFTTHINVYTHNGTLFFQSFVLLLDVLFFNCGNNRNEQIFRIIDKTIIIFLIIQKQKWTNYLLWYCKFKQ